MRKKLEKGYLLNLKSKEGYEYNYIIDEAIGEGASCIVYEADQIDEFGIPRRIRIKELYPIDSVVNRENSNLVWKSEDGKEKSKNAFEYLYKKQIAYQNNSEFTNSSSIITDSLLSASNTLYIVMDCANGKIFSKYMPVSLFDLFTVVKALLCLVQKYHNKKIVMLDIKPENFMVIEETLELIKYLDFDSIVALPLIKDNKASISFSRRWAAPEVIKGDGTKIDFGSDLYSIGAVTFNKIFGTDVTSKQRSLGFKPDFNNAYFNMVNPKSFKLITNFFRKTLSNNIQNRYASCEDAINDVDKILELVNPNSIRLISTKIDQRNFFVGRKNDLKWIHDRFTDGKSTVYINGCGGIGKTELAKQYANVYGESYHTIIWGKCTEGLEKLFGNDDVFNIAHFDSEGKIDLKIKAIRELVDEDTLVIIDNLDVLNDAYLDVLLSLNCKKLITTRAYLEGIISENLTTSVMHIGLLNKKESRELFDKYYQRELLEEQDEYIDLLLDYISGFPLMIPILAKQLDIQSALPKNLYLQIKNKKIKGVSSTFVKHYKDNNLVNATIYNQVLMLFDTNMLTENEKRTLYVLSLLGDAVIDRNFIAAISQNIPFNRNKESKLSIEETIEIICGEANIEYVNSLIEKGYIEYIKKDNEVYAHNVIRELSLFEFGYTIDDFSDLKDLLDYILSVLEDDYYDEGSKLRELFGLGFIRENEEQLNKVYFEEMYLMVNNIFFNIDFSKVNNLEYFSKRFISFIGIDHSLGNRIANKYQTLLSGENSIDEEYAKYLLMGIFLQRCIFFDYCKLDLQSYRENLKDLQMCIKYIQNFSDQMRENESLSIGIMFAHLANAYFTDNILYDISTEIIGQLIDYFALLKQKYEKQNHNLLAKRESYDDVIAREDYDVIFDVLCILTDEKEKRISYVKMKQRENTAIENPEKTAKSVKKDDLISFENLYEHLFDKYLSYKVKKSDKFNSISFINNDFEKVKNEIYKNKLADFGAVANAGHSNIQIQKVYDGTLPVMVFEDYMKQSEYLDESGNSLADYIYETYVTGNSYLFLNYILFNLFLYSAPETNVDLHKFLMFYFDNFYAELFLETLDEPLMILEMMKLRLRNQITIENIDYSRKNELNLMTFSENDFSEHLASFFEMCTQYAHQYGDLELYELVKKKEKRIRSKNQL